MIEEKFSKVPINQKLNKFIKRNLRAYFYFIFITTVVGCLLAYFENNPWKMGDWLINYQGGFVRRGIFGEIFYKLSSVTQINPGFFTFLAQVFFYAVFLYFSYQLLKKEKAILPYLLLIISPFILSFQINDLQGGARKEIIYFALLAWLVYCIKYKEDIESKTIVSLCLFPIIILGHEIFAVFLPYILICILSHKNLSQKKFIYLALCIPSVITFIFCLLFAGSLEHSLSISHSLNQASYPLHEGAIEWLGRSSQEGFQNVKSFIQEKNFFIYYFINLVLLSLAFIPIRKKLVFFKEKKLFLLLLLISFLGTLPLFFVAVDWGRFIYIHLVSLFLISFISPIKLNNQIYPFIVANKKAFFIFLIFYSLLWNLPHSAKVNPFPSKLSEVNIVSFFKPYIKISSYFNQ